MKFAENFKEARNRSGLTQEELARKLHISRQAVSRYENGTAEPSIAMLSDISVILDISLESLIGAKREVPEYKKFESLSKPDKRMLWYDFLPQHKLNIYFLPMIYLFCMNLGIGLAAFGFSRLFSADISRGAYIMLSIGAILISLAAIFLLFHNSVISSRKFNRWLREKNGVIRQRTLMII